jgi:exodeoxyribonuclease-5
MREPLTLEVDQQIDRGEQNMIVEEDQPVVAAEPITLNDEQQAAYDAIMAWLEARDPRVKRADGIELKYKKPKFQLPPGAEEWFFDNQDDYFVLKGFAGTGKSTLTSRLIVDLSEQDWNMVACAPTNKAVGVILEKVREAAQDRVLAATFKSVHSVCGLRMVETDEGEHAITDTGTGSLDQFTLAIIDEGSMLDTATLLRSIQAMRGKCLILIIGDPGQFPPIVEKAVAKVFRLPQGTMLRNVTRQAAGNPLIAASMKIRERNRIDEFLAGEADDFFAGMGPEDRVQASDLMEWLPKSMVRGSKNLLAMCVDYQRQGIDARIISYRNATVLNNNQLAHFELYPDSGRIPFSIGERVIVQSACKAEDISTGKTVDLATSEELVVEYIEREEHPNYPGVKAYMLVMKDDLGNLVKVYTPTLMTAFKHRCSELFATVNDINADLKRAPDPKLYDRLKLARGAAWGFKNSFAEIRHVYGMTAHKMQGSTVDVVLIDLPDLMTMQSAFEYNCGLYVAVTRPRHQAFIAY